jgi:hypothetical protein
MAHARDKAWRMSEARQGGCARQGMSNARGKACRMPHKRRNSNQGVCWRQGRTYAPGKAGRMLREARQDECAR